MSLFDEQTDARVITYIYDIADQLTIFNLNQMKASAIRDYESVLGGDQLDVYVVDDMGADASEIATRIRALDLILSEMEGDQDG